MNRPAKCTASSLTSNLACNGGDGRRGRWQAATGNDVMDSFKSFDELHLKRTLRADSGGNLQELPREPVIDTHLHSPRRNNSGGGTVTTHTRAIPLLLYRRQVLKAVHAPILISF